MSYIAVDTFGDEYIYPFKPERNILKNKLGEEWGYWKSTGCYHIEVPKGTARALYNANLSNRTWLVVKNKNSMDGKS